MGKNFVGRATLKLFNGYHLSPLKMDDRDALVEHLVCKEIYDMTLSIPYPYKAADADDWIEKNHAELQYNDKPLVMAIREASGKCIGNIGFMKPVNGEAELGYWLAKPYWGRGIVTEAAKAMCKRGFEIHGFKTIWATTVIGNSGSMRVLEKVGFKNEGQLKKPKLKDGKEICLIGWSLRK